MIERDPVIAGNEDYWIPVFTGMVRPMVSGCIGVGNQREEIYFEYFVLFSAIV